MAKAKYLWFGFCSRFGDCGDAGSRRVRAGGRAFAKPEFTGRDGARRPTAADYCRRLSHPPVGEGPQPVTTLDQDFTAKQGDQTIADVLQRLASVMQSQAFAGEQRMQKKKRREQKRPRLSSRRSVLIYAACLYEIGIVNTPLTEGLNFH